MPAALTSQDQARGLLWGLALGDALGWPVEFLDLAAIRARYGPAGIQAPPDPAIYTDDTQMTIALAEGLLEAGAGDLEARMAAVSRRFIAWSHDPGTPLTAPGNTCLRGVAALERGAPWRTAGVAGSKGCGACMRVAPVGFLYQGEPAGLRTVAQAQGWLTHRHPASDAACIAAAYLVKLVLDGAPPAAWPARVAAFAGGVSAEFDAALGRVSEALAWDDDQRALAHIGPERGGGWIAEEAVALALYCALRHPDDFPAAVRLGANIAGDSDSVAGIAGGLVGARLGPAGLPADWLARLQNRAGLQALADRLARQKARDDHGRVAETPR
jgi:ADP-ribosylglycohydrolase